ncbi:serine-rich adhesin for platelets isoform X1 [Anopheles funestus]|uniref:serine-rich adhesin for platelets isoform X1 n=2 Tax=Anopheles funestus TaxID=62324 RepID=UPI0020C62415|nr:serine-rich adhesin for platelets isoform X1 [Anopheles funestus]
MDVTLIVKASNQQCEDLTIKCEPSWTIRRLKGHLTEVYPGKPSTDEQKLIYSGQLLSDSVVLKDVLRQYDGQQAHTVHLVFTPKNSYYGGGGSSSSSGSKSNANSKMVSNASTSSAGTSSSSSSNGASNNRNSSTSVGSSASSTYEGSSREGVNNSEESNGDGLRQRSATQARSTVRTSPRPSQFVEQTAALQNFMQHTYMQYLNQYINLINEQQTNANALYSGSGLPGANGSAETAPTTLNPLSGNQPFPAVPFVPIVQSTAMAGGFPNFAYYPCMTPAPYASGFPSTSNIPTASSDASDAGSVTGVLPGVPSGANPFLSSSTHPSTGMASTSGQQIPSPQIPGIVNPPSSSSLAAGDATTPATSANGAEATAAAPAEQAAPQDAAPAAAAPARARRFPNIVVEEQENNDWLDVFFSMCRVGILITVIYLYSSPMRCLTVLFIGVMLYLKKHLDRVYQAIDRRIPRLQPAQDANGVAQREQQPVVAQPNNNVPEHNPEQQLPNEANVSAAGVDNVAKTNSSETESATSGTSDQQGSVSDDSTSNRTVVPRPRTSSAGRSTEQTPNIAEEEQQIERTTSEGEPAATAEQPAAEGQRMTFNDMTSFLGTLVITFFTSIIPDTPAA